jgi:DNA repair exonuclease SbcCD nuclease subunit
MDDNGLRQDATGRDQSRQDATLLDTDFVLTIEQVADLYAKAGHPRTTRSLQRYCAKGHLDSKRKETTFGGEVYLVSPQSVARHIAQIEELSSNDIVAPSRDTSRLVATTVVAQPSAADAPPPATTPDDTQRQAATGSDTSRYVERLEREVEQAKDERDFLREQIDRKDRTIEALIERDRETNFLIRGLQDLIPRLGMGRREPPEPPTMQ